MKLQKLVNFGYAESGNSLIRNTKKVRALLRLSRALPSRSLSETQTTGSVRNPYGYCYFSFDLTKLSERNAFCRTLCPWKIRHQKMGKKTTAQRTETTPYFGLEHQKCNESTLRRSTFCGSYLGLVLRSCGRATTEEVPQSTLSLDLSAGGVLRTSR